MLVDNKENKKIVLAADYRYKNQVLTTIKSVCYHNKDVQFYLFNRDFPEEWFIDLNKKLSEVESSIQNIKVDIDEIKNFNTYLHIQSDSTFFRYFIAEVVHGEKALYLDSDLIVNINLDCLFEIDLGNNYIAAGVDDLAINIHNVRNFNAGVMLINLALWRNEGIAYQALNLTERMQSNLAEIPDADQSILNILFEEKWLELSPSFNYLVGGEYLYRLHNALHLLQRKEDEIPHIIHYNTQYKPWKLYEGLPLSDYYWFYYELDWQDIIQKHLK